MGFRRARGRGCERGFAFPQAPIFYNLSVRIRTEHGDYA